MDWAGSLKLKIRVSNVEAENAKTDDLPAMTAHKTKKNILAQWSVID